MRAYIQINVKTMSCDKYMLNKAEQNNGLQIFEKVLRE